jgi:hypothetical protein
MDQYVRCDDTFLHKSKQIASAAGEQSLPPIALGLSGERYGILKVAGVGVGKGFHTSAPRILLRVMGRSFMRCPMAL